jgi:hypothetical protein
LVIRVETLFSSRKISRSGAMERSCSTKAWRRWQFAYVSRSVAWSDFFQPEAKLAHDLPEMRRAHMGAGLSLQFGLRLAQV